MAGNSVLSMNEIREAGVCVVALEGRVDSTNANDVMTRLTGLIAAGEKSVVVDLAAVRYLTSAAFRALLVATDEAERHAASFALCSLVGHVRELFEMGGLLDLFTIYASRQDALTSAPAAKL
jgi:anti-anti-sigma factor